MTRLRRDLIHAGAGLSLTLVSAIIVIDSAGAEPYLTFKLTDAVVQIGGACVVLILWLQFVIWVIAGVIRKRISIWWSASFIWAAVICFFVFDCPVAYAQDITKFVIERQ